MSNKNLSDQEGKLWQYMTQHGQDVDVAILSLHDHVRGPMLFDADSQTIQRYVGSVISKVNRKVVGFKIIPGELKRTYRLVRT